ncbi:hypothetical protein K3172_13090 [Qipengyuania sp. 6B39]|uniref:hypothetical protein n=1 Tax=Qipengyuania proteolytica TaxID=2867239 RepID=UPI001C8A51A8|nr:hypothetical protein [Qipengyuania proteolytica]MBX7496795.1 hypothetical protein [Qipengyuania proteolytica]
MTILPTLVLLAIAAAATLTLADSACRWWSAFKGLPSMSYDHYRPDPSLRLLKHGPLVPMADEAIAADRRKTRLLAATSAALIALALTGALVVANSI